jgi:DNA recombination-dependent growth factor C
MTTATLRKGGSYVAMQWTDGAMPHPHDQEFRDALAQHRFRTIENAASEEVSIGWVTPDDPSGDSHELEDMVADGTVTWLRVRLDKKALPKAWVQIRMDEARRAKGKPLTARERRELKDSLAEEWLPGIKPTVTGIDALLLHERKTVLLFSSSKSARESFAQLWAGTFGVSIHMVGPYALAVRQGFDAEVLDKLEPTRWPVAAGGAS